MNREIKPLRDKVLVPPANWKGLQCVAVALASNMPEDIWNKREKKKVEQVRDELFDITFLPYLDSAYNLARWLTQNEHDAEDVVQEAFLRALRSFDTFIPSRNARAWLLAIVRNCCHNWHRQARSQEISSELDMDTQPSSAAWSDPEALLIRNTDAELLRQAMEQLPFEYREVLILRELEELGYKEIAAVIDVPLGTVMSRLSRARKQLSLLLSRPGREMTI